jgi:hypothetical protein
LIVCNLKGYNDLEVHDVREEERKKERKNERKKERTNERERKEDMQQIIIIMM